MSNEKIDIIIENQLKGNEKIIAYLDDLNKEMKLVSRSTEQAEKSLGSFSRGLSSTIKLIGSFFIVDKMKDAAVATLRAAGEMEQYSVAFKTMLGSAERADTLLKEITNFAKQTPFEIKGLVNASKQMLAFGIEAEQVIPTINMLGNIASGLGVPIERLGLVYGQVRAKGKLMGDDLRQFTEAGIPLIEALSQTTGRSIAELQKLDNISFAEVQKALVALTSEGGKFFNLMQEQSKTLLGSWANLKDSVNILAVEIGNKLSPYAQAAIRFITEKVTQLSDAIKTGKIDFSAFAQVASTVFSIIGNVAITAYNGVSYFISGIKALIPLFRELTIAGAGVATFMGGVFLSNFIAANGIVGTLKIGMLALFAVMKAHPFALVVTAIGGVITAIGYLRDNSESVSLSFKGMKLRVEEAMTLLLNFIQKIVINILDALSKLSDLPGFKWTEQAKKDMQSFADSSINDINRIRNELIKLNGEKAQISVTKTTQDNNIQKKVTDSSLNIAPVKINENPQLIELQKAEQAAKELKDLKKKQNAERLELDRQYEKQKGELDGSALKDELDRELVGYQYKLLQSEQYQERKKEIQQRYLADEITQKQFQDEQDALNAQIKQEALQMQLDAEYQKESDNTDRLVALKKKRFDEEKKAQTQQSAFEKFMQSDTMIRAEQGAKQLINLQENKNKAIAAIGKAAAIFQIGVDTQAAAMSAYKALAGIPVVGPALGAAAAAAITIDGVMRAAKVTGMSFAVGTPEVPKDMTAQIHKGEGIVPKTFMDGIRENQLGMVGGKTLNMLESIAEKDKSAQPPINISVIMDNNSFYGQIGDEMIYEIGTRLGQMIKENLLTAIPTAKA